MFSLGLLSRLGAKVLVSVECRISTCRMPMLLTNTGLLGACEENGMLELASDPGLSRYRELLLRHREVGWEIDFTLSEGHSVPLAPHWCL